MSEREYRVRAATARAELRALGLADSVHYAPDWRRRATALYERLNAHGDGPVDVGIRHDGRMVAIGETVSVIET